jgi:hypothetical protein
MIKFFFFSISTYVLFINIDHFFINIQIILLSLFKYLNNNICKSFIYLFFMFNKRYTHNVVDLGMIFNFTFLFLKKYILRSKDFMIFY